MLKQLQLIKTETGDCLRTCIANLLEYPVDEVPNFLAIDGEVDGWELWWFNLQEWLMRRGYFFLEVRLTKHTPWFPLPFDALCMFVGHTNATKGKPEKERHRHAVIGRVGKNEEFEVLHDPLPEGSGLEQVESLCFLVPLDPSIMKKTGIMVPANKPEPVIITPGQV